MALLRPDGALWFRGLATWMEEDDTLLRALTDKLQVRRIVAGHSTALDGHIKNRFDGRVFLIDTGMLSSHYEGGRPSALVLDGDRAVALYLDSEEELE